MPDDGLDAEPVENGAEHAVVVETRGQVRVEVRLARLLPVDDALVQIGGPQSPDPTGELDVVAVVDLGQVVEGPRLLRVGQGVGPALVGDLDETLFDIDVGCSVLTHGAELDQMDRRVVLGDGVQEVERAHHVIDLCVHGVLTVDHRIGRRTLFGEMHDGFGLETGEDAVDEDGIGQVTDERLQPEPRHLFPDPHPVLELTDGDETVHPHLMVVLTPDEVVDYTDVVSATRQVQRRRPSQVPVTAEHEDPQPCHLLWSPLAPSAVCKPCPGPERFARDTTTWDGHSPCPSCHKDSR